jgi:pimeloyl-ACP methyl ester carboxylesterase
LPAGNDGMTSGQEREIQAGIPGSELAIFEESSHYPFAEERERFLATLAGFLTRAERQTGP